MRVQFLRDYRGKLTRENYYLSGARVEFDDGTARALIAEGVAVAATAKPVETAPAKPARRRRESNGGVL